MRITVTLDAETERLIRARMRQRGVSFKQALNDAIRAGLTPGDQGRRRRFTQKTFDLGAEQLFRWDKALATAEALEDEESMAGRRLAPRY